MPTPPVDPNLAITAWHPLLGHSRALKGLAWDPGTGNRLVSWAWDNTIRVWDIATGRHREFTRRWDGYDSAALAPEGLFLASATHEEGVQIWDSANGKLLRNLGPQNTKVEGLAWAPTGGRLAWAAYGEVWFWDIEHGSPTACYPSNAFGPIKALAWDPAGEQVVTGSERNMLQLWNAQVGQQSGLRKGHTSDVLAVAWAPNGQRFYSGSRDETICVWDPTRQEPMRRIKSSWGTVTGLAVTPDGTLLVSQHHKHLCIWRTDTWAVLVTFAVGHALHGALAMHAQEPIIATRGVEAQTILLGRINVPALFGTVPFKPNPAPIRPVALRPVPPAPLTAQTLAGNAAEREAARVLAHKQAIKKYDVFISYSIHNRRWVEGTLVPQLNARGIHCFVEGDFKVGAARLKEIERAIKQCPKTLLVLSKSWLMDEWTGLQSLVAQTQDPAALERRLLPLIYQPAPIPPRLAPLTSVDFTKPSRRARELDRLVAAILGE